MDSAEKLYLLGFPVLLAFITLVSVKNQKVASTDGNTPTSGMEFLPLMATSVYCAIGMVWSFLRLGFIYLFEESSYQGQLSVVQ